MKTVSIISWMVPILSVIVLWTGGRVSAEGTQPSKNDSVLSTYVALPKEDGKVTLEVAGKTGRVTATIAAATVLGGICQDCQAPLEFIPALTAKVSECGCASNAVCIAGKGAKEGTWQAMLKALPRGVGLNATFNVADQPESGLKKLIVDLRTIMLPVEGLTGKSPEQLQDLAKAIGAKQAELIDGGQRLVLRLKTDWSAQRSIQLDKALAALNAKVISPDAPKADH